MTFRPTWLPSFIVIVILPLVFVFVPEVHAQDAIKLLLLRDSEDDRAILSSWRTGPWEVNEVMLDRKDKDGSKEKVCTALSGGVSLVVDLTFGDGWSVVRTAADSAGVPYMRVQSLFGTVLATADDFLVRHRSARDTALIFQHRRQLEESLYYLVHTSPLRVILFEGLAGNATERLRQMRPTPNYFLLFADTNAMNNIYKMAADGNLTKLNDRWNLIFTDFAHDRFDRSMTKMRTIAIMPNKTFCCGVHNAANPCACQDDADLEKIFLDEVIYCIEEADRKMRSRGSPMSATKVTCQDGQTSSAPASPFDQYFSQCINGIGVAEWDEDDRMVAPAIGSEVAVWRGTDPPTPLGHVAEGLVVTPAPLPPVRRFFRVGTGYSIPFGYPKITNGKMEYNEEGKEVWEGYCIDLINKLSEQMEFDYELVTSYDFGRKHKNGTWDGLVGMLASARIDIVVAPLTMTSEREEVIDFIAPYFEQTGFSIVIRKPVRTVSLFKFMTVLKVEVWLSILAALVSTAIMIWFLDKYSPYSARNNKAMYPYPCRDFTLKESFWFAVTSFTPQGGGEAPKPLSARTLVAAYWLFVVLMLATFTANLAAFLTVERMQSPVQSLDQLAKQSRINYTVVTNSEAHSYFRNMKNAEDTLYRVWKEITLNASSDQSEYRVWDYPIKEQYSRILLAIQKTGTVDTAEEGYKKVIESEQGEFALIHDALEIRYQVDRNCNITEIGEPFAEQPYAIAVQQGSQINEEISRRILDMQRDRYFEELTAKYWNASLKGKCNDIDENEGITLESLGGVFIATLVGLALAMITLGFEVYYQKKKEKNEVKQMTPTKKSDNQKKPKDIQDELYTSKEYGLSFGKKKSNAFLEPAKPNVTYISVYPRGQLY